MKYEVREKVEHEKHPTKDQIIRGLIGFEKWILDNRKKYEQNRNYNRA